MNWKLHLVTDIWNSYAMLASEEMIKSLILNHTEWACWKHFYTSTILLLVIAFYIKHSGFILSSSYKTNQLNPRRAQPGFIGVGCTTRLLYSTGSSLFYTLGKAELDVCVFPASPDFTCSFVWTRAAHFSAIKNRKLQERCTQIRQLRKRWRTRSGLTLM